MQRHSNQAEFIFPQDGVMLTYAAGEKIGDSLKIQVLFSAQDGKQLSLNGVPMKRFNFCEYTNSRTPWRSGIFRAENVGPSMFTF